VSAVEVWTVEVDGIEVAAFRNYEDASSMADWWNDEHPPPPWHIVRGYPVVARGTQEATNGE
jgi:hypothetical protein